MRISFLLLIITSLVLFFPLVHADLGYNNPFLPKINEPTVTVISTSNGSSGGSSSNITNSTVLDLIAKNAWLLSGLNDPPTADWDMGGFRFFNLTTLFFNSSLFTPNISSSTGVITVNAPVTIQLFSDIITHGTFTNTATDDKYQVNGQSGDIAFLDTNIFTVNRFYSFQGTGIEVTNGNASINGTLRVFNNATFFKNISAPNICYSDGVNCTASVSSSQNLTNVLMLNESEVIQFNLTILGNLSVGGFYFGNGTFLTSVIHTEVDPAWSPNFTNMQNGCPTGNFTNGIFNNGSFKCGTDTSSSGVTSLTNVFFKNESQTAYKRNNFTESVRINGSYAIGSANVPLFLDSSAITRLGINSPSASNNTGVGFFTNNALRWSASAYLAGGTNIDYVFFNDQTNINSFFIDGDSDAVSFGTTTTLGQVGIKGVDTTVRPSLAIRQGNDVSYGFDWDLETVSTGRLDLYRVQNSARNILATFLRQQSMVGINTTAPVVTLDVAGYGRYTKDLNVSLNLSVGNLISCDTIDSDANGRLFCGTDGGSAAQVPQQNNASAYYSVTTNKTTTVSSTVVNPFDNESYVGGIGAYVNNTNASNIDYVFKEGNFTLKKTGIYSIAFQAEVLADGDRAFLIVFKNGKSIYNQFFLFNDVVLGLDTCNHQGQGSVNMLAPFTAGDNVSFGLLDVATACLGADGLNALNSTTMSIFQVA